MCFIFFLSQIEDVGKLVSVEDAELLIEILFVVGSHEAGVCEIFKFNIKVFSNIYIFWRKIVVHY